MDKIAAKAALLPDAIPLLLVIGPVVPLYASAVLHVTLCLLPVTAPAAVDIVAALPP